MHNILQAGAHCKVSLDRQRELLQAIIDEVREDILVLDKEGRVVDMNKNVRSRLHKTKDELVGLPCHQIMVQDSGAPFCLDFNAECPAHATMAAREPAEALFTRVDPDGRLEYYRVYSYPILNPKGDMTHILIMRRNITSRTHKERSEQHRDKMATMGEMAAFLAHEIRNPLFAISGFAKSVSRAATLSDAEREKLDIIMEETARMDRMLSSVLNFARPAHVQANAVDLNKVAAETVELMRVGYCQKGHDLLLDVAPNLPLVLGQADVIKQCLVNLIKNAVEALRGPGEIRVHTGQAKGMVYVQVQDSGQGMSEAELEKVFSPFYTTKDKGYGLGLAMIKKIQEELGGKVTLVSKQGEGATVTLYYPPDLARNASQT